MRISCNLEPYSVTKYTQVSRINLCVSFSCVYIIYLYTYMDLRVWCAFTPRNLPSETQRFYSNSCLNRLTVNRHQWKKQDKIRMTNPQKSNIPGLKLWGVFPPKSSIPGLKLWKGFSPKFKHFRIKTMKRFFPLVPIHPKNSSRPLATRFLDNIYTVAFFIAILLTRLGRQLRVGQGPRFFEPQWQQQKVSLPEPFFHHCGWMASHSYLFDIPQKRLIMDAVSYQPWV